MVINQGKSYLSLADFEQHSIWKFSDLDDLNYPVLCAEDFPESSFDLRIRTKFTTPNGIGFLGCIVGVKNIYTIAIFVADQVFYFNRNLPGDYPNTLNNISKVLGQQLTMKDFSPLKFITDIDLPGFKNIEGEFDLLKKRTDDERLQGL